MTNAQLDHSQTEITPNYKAIQYFQAYKQTVHNSTLRSVVVTIRTQMNQVLKRNMPRHTTLPRSLIQTAQKAHCNTYISSNCIFMQNIRIQSQYTFRTWICSKLFKKNNSKLIPCTRSVPCRSFRNDRIIPAKTQSKNHILPEQTFMRS